MGIKNDRTREFYIFTLILVPTLLVGITAQYINNFFVRSVVLAILIFFQAVITKGIIEKH